MVRFSLLSPGRRFFPAGRVLAAMAGLCLMAGLLASGGAAARAATAPPGPSRPAGIPAAAGPGLRAAPASIAVSQAQVCGKVAAKAGFSYNNYISTNDGSHPVIVVAVAIALAESSCTSNVYLCNPSLEDGYYPPVSCPSGTSSYDRGLWQINSYYHSNVSDACAFQIQCNADAAFSISDSGYSWTPWATYTSGAWESYISLAQEAVYGFSFQLQDQHNGTCLDADSSDVGNGGKIFQWACNSSDSYQQWEVTGSVGSLPILKNVGAGTCLDLDGSDIGNGAPIFQWACSTSDSFQKWWFYGSGDLNTNGNADAGVRNDGTSKTCLDADGSDSGNGAPIFQWTCNQSDSAQEWN